MIVDLSHDIAPGALTYARPTSAGRAGTYLEAPYHVHAGRADLAQLPLERLVNVPIVMIRSRQMTAVTPAVLDDPDRLWGKAVLIHTGWARHWRTDRYVGPGSPYLTAAGASTLIDANVALVGIDARFDDPADPHQSARRDLLGADIPVVEHLTNLEAVPDEGARLTVLPAPVRAMATFPVRAVATYEPE
ncbi:cyclase family protein [Dactylosporangium sp. NPDC005572]|uniref:cyclase family protein n=1 Tax=Dactylosporangium sp. NPDC005572 TaxID=3156889 RepID=UPI0033BC9986